MSELETLAKRIQELRREALCDERDLTPQSSEFFLLALSALEQAQRYAILSHYAEMQSR